MSHHWIDDPEHLDEFCWKIPEGAVVAVDTESDHFFAYNAYVALIQLATPEEVAIIDPLAIEPEEMKPFLRLLEDESVTKIMHSCRNDIREIDRDWGIKPVNVFDTQLAARFLRYQKTSLDALLQKLEGIKLDKKYQRFDWSKRPLPSGAIDYAAGDVIHLFSLRERLLRELQAERWLEPFRQQMEWVVEISGYEEKPFDPEDWRSMKPVKKADLDGRGRAAVAALYVWRHELCERLNRAPLHVFPNHALVEVARRRPKTVDELKRVKHVHDNLVRHDGKEIVELLAEAAKADPPPARRPRSSGDRLPREERDLRDELKTMRREVADELEMPAHLVLDREVMYEIAHLRPSSLDELDAIHGFHPWQRELLGSRILGLCS